jgi:general secretion pathway protein G
MNEQEKRTVREALRQGFTLMEILIAVAIIGILGAVALPALMGNLGSSRNTAARELIANVETALNMYNMKKGRYPDSLEELTKETDDEEALLQGEYIDPWGKEIQYEKPKGKKRPLLISAGEDGEFGTEDDITNKDKDKNKK